MDYKLSRAWAEIHIDRIKNNIANIKKYIAPETKLMAVVKADAYGHGFYETAKIVVSCGADYLGVACIDEAKQIRRRGINTPILILGATPSECVPDLFRYDVMPTVFENEILPAAISEYAVKTGSSLKIHIKVDTGMGRLGFPYFPYTDAVSREAEKSISDILKTAELPGIEVEGIFTHFSNADDPNGREITLAQLELFKDITEKLERGGLAIPIKHTANSAAVCLYNETQFSMVRAGLIIYGEYPSLYVKENTGLKVEPVMEIKARISQVKEVGGGIGVSYGKTYYTKHTASGEPPQKLATVCVGYADSYFRRLSNKTRVIVNGRFAPQVGNICMDQMVIDVSGIDSADLGAEVTLIGENGGKTITFSDIAGILSTINYEIMCNVGKRVVKAYFDNGKLKEVVNYLDNY